MNAAPHIAIIDPAARVAETDCYNRIARRSHLTCTYYLPALQHDTLPVLDGGLRGVVIFGSGASVHDVLTWQDTLRSWLTPVVQAGVPILGICYGHQLLAHMLGGEVGFYNAQEEKLTGFRKVKFVGQNLPWQQKKLNLLVSHREVVTGVPDCFEVIATSESVKIEGLRHKSLPIITIQAHPEATLTFLQHQSISPPANPDDVAAGHPVVDEFIQKLTTDS